MNRTDLERLKKIADTWAAAEAQIRAKTITPELLMEDEFS